MWLLNVNTLILEYFMSAKAVPGKYAILSHTWGAEEPTFDNIHSPEAKGLQGYKKIERTCQQAKKDGYRYAWVDTVCIDKRSSAELSEAINSMFNWYRLAGVCYAYLEDVRLEGYTHGELNVIVDDSKQFRLSRWFTRSWTLQELLAPDKVWFYDSTWRFIGDKAGLAEKIHEITHIDHKALAYSSAIPFMSVAKRMSWAARREASREEDAAYALLGIFNVNMPMLYGEGGYKAFRRLQEEIIRGTTDGDHSILAWQTWDTHTGPIPYDPLHDAPDAMYLKRGLLAPHVYGFRHAHDIVSWSSPRREVFEISYRGLKLTLLMSGSSKDAATRMPTTEVFVDSDVQYAALNCRYEREPWTHIVLSLQRSKLGDHIASPTEGSVNVSDEVWDRVNLPAIDEPCLRSIPMKKVNRYTGATVILAEQPFYWPCPGSFLHITPGDSSCNVVGSHPPNAWDKRHSILKLTEFSRRSELPDVGRAAILLSDSNSRADIKIPKTITVIISVDLVSYNRVAHVPSPQVLAIPGDALRDLGDIRETQMSVPPGKSRTIPMEDGSSIRVKSEYMSAADQMIWSLSFSRTAQNLANIDPRTMTSNQQLSMNPGIPLRFDTTERAREAGPSAGRALKLFWRGY